MKTHWIKQLLRLINRHSLWRTGMTRVWNSLLRAPTFDRWLALQLHRAGLMGAADRKFLEAQIKPGMTVADIGANQGLYTLLFSRLTGESGKVYAFEPDDLLQDALQGNLALNRVRNVEPLHLALGSARGTMTLYRSLLNSGDNCLAPKSADEGPREAVQVQVERLDEVLAGQRVDFIKMDVQGWEMEAFRGMQGLLDAPVNAEMSIYFEYYPQGLRDAGSDPVEPLAFLVRNGFAIFLPKGSEFTSTTTDLNELAATVTADRYINLYALRPKKQAC